MSLDVERPSPEQAASDLLRRWYDAWNAHDVDAISALMTDDVFYEDPGATQPLTRGRAPVEDWARTAFRAVPDMHLELLEEWVSPGGAVIASYFHFTATGTGPLEPPGLAPTNAPYDAYGMDRSEIRMVSSRATRSSGTLPSAVGPLAYSHLAGAAGNAWPSACST